MKVPVEIALKVTEYTNHCTAAHNLFEEIRKGLSEIDNDVDITDVSTCHFDHIPPSAERQKDGTYVSQSGNCDYGYSGTVYLPVQDDDVMWIAVGYIC